MQEPEDQVQLCSPGQLCLVYFGLVLQFGVFSQSFYAEVFVLVLPGEHTRFL